ncbi:MAG TPA: tRNA (N(6)-L-threonylcarbamoyladenosine(37)-C(2))-methylthiotransferase MtaB [Bryobacteraceae bacterium]|jgi:threonylcarbamoyladenosine tRNA methylthiotransferase MtaB|nr:tRNA (N(6)-L-threonylcarbamoyladenosine(37)-C(2))-methylthiotransferase MtaB [Bryobacteraceae bacterium]
MRFFVQNFGCRATQADGAALEAQLSERGFAASDHRESADLVVLNTCTVTAEADSDARSTIRRVHRENPAARILVTGCYAQRAPDELAKMPGVEWVVGNSHKTQLADLVSGAVDYHGQVAVGDIVVGDIMQTRDILSAPIMEATGDRTRPNLKIQDGCHNRCSFCIIPFVRGKSRYSGPDQIVEQVRALSSKYREVVLSGINLGRWGRESGSTMRLVDLLRRLLQETEIDRLRLSSVEPMDFSDDLLGLMAETPRISKHVHAPLQSGSDAILRKMHRKYRPRHYADRVAKARLLMPEAAIGADVMVGFPGETDELFEESRQFIEAMPFTYLHVFTYSERPGTPAAQMPGVVPIRVRKDRNRVLRDLAAEKNVAFRQSLLGGELTAVTLDPPGLALTDNYIKASLDLPYTPNRLVKLRPRALNDQGFSAQLISAA